MYMDSVVAFGLLIVVLSMVMISYVGFYAYRHIKADIETTDNAAKRN